MKPKRFRDYEALGDIYIEIGTFIVLPKFVTERHRLKTNFFDQCLLPVLYDEMETFTYKNLLNFKHGNRTYRMF